jgi:hypothetical protein
LVRILARTPVILGEVVYDFPTPFQENSRTLIMPQLLLKPFQFIVCISFYIIMNKPQKETFGVRCSALQVLCCVSGGSLLSIGSLEKRKGLKKLAKNLGKF